jgi:hypothetical protein
MTPSFSRIGASTEPGALHRYPYLRTGLERTRFREALDPFDLRIVLGDALRAVK